MRNHGCDEGCRSENRRQRWIKLLSSASSAWLCLVDSKRPKVLVGGHGHGRGSRDGLDVKLFPRNQDEVAGGWHSMLASAEREAILGVLPARARVRMEVDDELENLADDGLGAEMLKWPERSSFSAWRWSLAEPDEPLRAMHTHEDHSPRTAQPLGLAPGLVPTRRHAWTCCTKVKPRPIATPDFEALNAGTLGALNGKCLRLTAYQG